MNRKNELFLYGAMFLVLGGIAEGDFVFSFGSTSIQPNMANQQVQLYASFTPGASSATMIGGLQLNVRIGDGSGTAGSAPVFQGSSILNSQQGVSFAGTIWDGASTDLIGQAPVDGFPQYASIGISFTNNTDFRTLTNSPQLVARLFLDTTNVFAGNVGITLNDQTLGQSYFQSKSDVPLLSETIVSTNANLTINAVPEPSSSILVSCTLAACFWLRRRSPSVRNPDVRPSN